MTKEITVPEGYFCTKIDKLGVFYGPKGISVDKTTKVICQKEKAVCGLFAITAILRDNLNNNEYVEFKYLKSGKMYKEVFKGDQLGEASCISTLTAAGFAIINKTLFYQVVQSVRLAISVFEDANDEEVEADKNFIVRRGDVYIKYGYQLTNHGYDLTHFVKKDEIIRFGNQDSVDAPLFETKGTFEGQKEDIELISRYFKPKHVFQTALATTCMPVILPYIGQLENPIYCIAGPSSIGKKFLATIQAGIWGCSKDVEGTGIMRGSDTGAAWTQILNRINTLPIINPEMQDVINEIGEKGVADMLYLFTKGTFGERSKSNENALRGDNRIWRTVWTFYCEANQFQRITGGANNRYIMIDSGLIDGEQYIQGEFNNDDFRENTISNYGHIGPHFVNSFIEYSKTHNVYKEWNNIKEECKKYLKNPKKANSVGLLIYTYNLMIDFCSLPRELGKLDIQKYCEVIGDDNLSKDPFDEVFGYWIANLLKDPSIRRLDEVIGEEEYRNLATSAKEIRGRYEIKEKYMYIYIPEDKLVQQLDHIAYNVLKIDGAKMNKKLLAKKGILQTNTEGKYLHKKRDITRVYTKEKGYEKVLILKVPIENEIEQKLTKEDIKDII